MAAPKPISLTQVDTNTYTGLEPQPFVIVGDIPGGSTDLNALLAALPGFDSGEVQTLTNTSGTFEWVTNE